MGEDRFASLGLSPRAWEAAAGERFGEHAHERRKLLVCRSGAISFTLWPAGERRDLAAGDWIDLPAGQRHSAVAGAEGCRCEEAFG